MSIKDLFRGSDIIASSSLESLERDVESAEYIKPYIEDQERLIPHIDFTDPANFAAYGSAQEYYEKSIEHIYAEYPYDGSLKEKIEWRNSATLLDLYILDNRYPKTTGYAIFAADNTSGAGWGANTGSVTNGYGSPAVSDYEYINLEGGPTSPYGSSLGTSSLSDVFGSRANVWDTDVTGSGTRESNLKTDLDTGITVEFWFKTGSLAASLTEKQVIFDLWNNESSASATYGRFRIEVDGKAGTTRAAAPFRVTLLSGTTGLSTSSLDIGSSLDLNSFSDWQHYAFTLVNSGSNIVTKLYVNGDLSETITTGSNISEIINPLQANIGALLTGTMNIPAVASANTAPNLGWGKLSGSVDDFRFWKVKRDSEQIGRHWFTSNLGGGTNTDFANTALGVYYKFNEGITTDSEFDSVVLDYSGRLTNGTWTGYNTSARNTGSAMVSASAGIEDLDPIIRVSHPDVATLKTELIASGTLWDYENNSSLYYTMPSWIIEEDEQKGTTGDLRKLTQVLGTYFDNLQLQIGELSKLNIASYPSSSAQGELFKPYVYANRAVRSHGLDAPELFSNIDMLEYFGNRNEDKEYEQDIQIVKSFIYNNIYNNLANIYKSKGTERAIRNLIACFGIDEDLIRLNAYADNQTYKFETKRRAKSYKTKAVDFNQIDRFAASVHQFADSSNANSVSYISGSAAQGVSYEDTFPITMEAEIIFPAKQEFDSLNKWREDFSYATASLFGMHTAIASASMDGTENDLTWGKPNVANFQVYAIRDKALSHDAYFMLSSSNPFPIPELTTSYYQNVYDNQKWNFAVRLKPFGYPQTFTSGALDNGYTVEFYGVNYVADRKINEFELTQSLTRAQAEMFLTSSKRAYVGANKTDFTGSTVDYTDVKITSAKYWFDYVDNTTIQNHAIDPSSFGTINPSRDSYLLESDLSGTQIPQIESLALYWDFDTVTSSNASGRFTVEDVSSGSVADSSRYDWIGGIVKRQHTGRGFAFPVSATGSVENQFLYAGRQQLPEVVYGDDNIRVLSQEETEVFTRETRPTKTYYAFEKSMYQVISDEILNYFASIKEFNNLIGEPVHRYRPEYKSLKHLRQFFFERVRNEPDLDKFIDYYKWIDATLEAMLMQLVPATAQMSEGIDNIVESHILERNKYWSKFPTAEFNTPTPETGALGINQLLYNWKRGHRPISGDQSDNCFWWKQRAERDTNFQSPLNLNATGSQHQDATNDRLAIYTASVQVLERSYTTPYRFSVEKDSAIHGGINYGENKIYHYYRGANFPHGPIDSMHVPQNVLVVFNAGTSDDIAEMKDCDDDTTPAALQKKKYTFGALVGRLHWSGSYEDAKGAISVPFSLISASQYPDPEPADPGVGRVAHIPSRGGYNRLIQNRFKSGSQLVNLHNDGYGDLNEVPMQGPFTEKYVGGHQARHVRLNNFSEGRVGADGLTATNDLDGQYTRPEAWRILLGGGPKDLGGLGITGPDYGGPYPDQQRMRAWFFREETTKRPVNIRNILQTTSSVDTVISGVLQHGPIGNYQKTYQVVQSSGRSTNNFWFNNNGATLPAKYVTNNPKTTNLHTLVAVRPAGAGLPNNWLSKNMRSQGNGFIASPSSSANIGSEQHRNYAHLSNLYYPKAAVPTSASDGSITVIELPNRDKQDAIIVERFSAPGGPEVNSLGFLDIMAAEKSVYNALPYRNLMVRGSGSGEEEVFIEGSSGDVRPATMRVIDHISKSRGLRTLLSLHAGPAGSDGTYGVLSAADYVTSPSFHKINRNRTIKIESDQSTAYDNFHQYGTASIYDNFFVQHPIPRNDLQYAWISSSIATGALGAGRAYGHAPRSGMVSGSAGMEAAITFISGSLPDYSGAASTTASIIPVDFVGLNTLIHDPTGSEFNILSASWQSPGFPYQMLEEDPSERSGWSIIDQAWEAELYAGYLNTSLIKMREDLNTSPIGSFGTAASGTITIGTTNPSDLHNKTITIEDNFGVVRTYTFKNDKAPNGGNDAASICEVGIQGLSSTSLIAEQLAHAITNSAGATVGMDGTDTCRNHVTGEGGCTLTCDLSVSGKVIIRYASGSTDGRGIWTRAVNRSVTGSGTGMWTSVTNTDLLILPVNGFFGGEDPLGTPARRGAFNALMLHRNGPYGYSSWRQVRNEYHSLVRQMKKNNIISIIEPTSERSHTRTVAGYPGYSWGPEPKTLQDIYGSGDAVIQDREVLRYDEPAVTIHKPMTFESDVNNPDLASPGSVYNVDKKVFWKATYTNQKKYFTNSKLNEKLRLANDRETPGDILMDAFQQAQVTSEFRNFKYTEPVYPSVENKFHAKVRQRQSYDCLFWKKNHRERIVGVPYKSGVPYFLDLKSSFFGGGSSIGKWLPKIVSPLSPEDLIGSFSTAPSTALAVPWVTSQGQPVLSQSIWPLDGRLQFDASCPNYDGDTLSSTNRYDAKVYVASGTVPSNPGLTGSGCGELQNCRTTVHSPTIASGLAGGSEADQPYTTVSVNNPFMFNLTASALYSRKHTLATGSSILPWSSIYYKNKQPKVGIIGHVPQLIVPFAGDASWDAPTQFGKNPFYDSYNDYVTHMRAHGKEYSILPEFRMSDKMDDYLVRGIDPFDDTALFALTGAVVNTTSSHQEDFYKIYSHSDFMQYFDVVSSTASVKLNAAPVEFAVTCKAMLKLLPYDGFYPASRTLQIASLFSQSYGTNIHITGTIVNSEAPAANNPTVSGAYSRAILAPMFAPGLLYNSIKSGLAVDFPVFTTGSPGYVTNDSSSHGNMISYCIGNPHFHERLPFETLVEPENHLANKNIYDMEVHPSCSFYGIPNEGALSRSVNGSEVVYFDGTSTAIKAGDTIRARWNGQGDARYKLAMNNFLAETPEFFLESETLTSFFSAPQSQWKVPDKNKSYKMRVALRKSSIKTKFSGSSVFGAEDRDGIGGTNYGGDAMDYPYPQIVSGTETISMYSRPSAFGPPVGGGFPDVANVGGEIERNYSDNGQNCGFFGDSRTGYNPAFTPAYYDGEAWADLEYNPGLYADEGVPTLETLLSRITASYLRFCGPLTGTLTTAFSRATDAASKDLFYYGMGGPRIFRSLDIAPAKGPMSGAYECNTNSNQVSSSVNLFGSTKGLRDLLKYEGYSGTEEGQWVIQTKYETPILNFADNSSSAGSTAVGVTRIKAPSITDNKATTFFSGGLHTRPIGMWHQYGRLPTGEEGIYMEIKDIPYEQRFLFPEASREPMAGVPDVTASLADLVGFSKSSQKLGRVAQSKTISEAVVAVPFVENTSGTREFYNIDKRQVEFILGTGLAQSPLVPPKQSVIDMVETMQKYNFPPSMDFVKYPDIVDPFSMYIFEFEHKLNQQDLLNIWQNLPPRIARAFDPDEPLDTSDIMQTKTVSHTLEEGQLLNDIDSKLKWMVFKVKQRAQTNYFSKVVQDNYGLSVPKTVRGSGLIDLNVQQYSAGGAGIGGVSKGDPYSRSYNWPYDFFSLVELVKIDDEVTYSTVQTVAGQGVIRVPDGVTSLPAPPGQVLRQQVTAPDSVIDAITAGPGSLVAAGGPGGQLEGTVDVLGSVASAAAIPQLTPGGVRQQVVQGAAQQVVQAAQQLPQSPGGVRQQVVQGAAQQVVQAAQSLPASPPAQQAAPVVSTPAVSVRRVRNINLKK